MSRSLDYPAPVPKLGRNDPCHCGSGKKYKHCHADEDAEASRRDVDRARALHRFDHEVCGRLAQFANKALGPGWDHPDLLPAIDELAPAAIQFIAPWLFYHAKHEDLTIAEAYLLAGADRLPQTERAWLEAQVRAHFDIWEIIRVEPGRGIQVESLTTGDSRFIIEEKGSAYSVPRDALLARLIDFDSVSVFCGTHPRPLSPEYAAEVLSHLKRELRSRAKKTLLERMRTQIGQSLLAEIWEDAVDAMSKRPAPTLTNTDGEEMIVTKDIYDIIDSAAHVETLLRSIEGAEPHDDDASEERVVTISKIGNRVHAGWPSTVVANAFIKEKRLVVETNSTKRADAMKKSVLATCGAAVRYRLRETEDASATLEKMLAGEDRGRGRAKVPEMTPEICAVLRQQKDAHYRDWLDQPIPALRGKTPREAAADPRRRGELELLLKQLENSEGRSPPEERANIHVLRRELGFAT